MALNVLELFSGIGGMHFALEAAELHQGSRVVAAVDISDVPNKGKYYLVVATTWS